MCSEIAIPKHSRTSQLRCDRHPNTSNKMMENIELPTTPLTTTLLKRRRDSHNNNNDLIINDLNSIKLIKTATGNNNNNSELVDFETITGLKHSLMLSKNNNNNNNDIELQINDLRHNTLNQILKNNLEIIKNNNNNRNNNDNDDTASLSDCNIIVVVGDTNNNSNNTIDNNHIINGRHNNNNNNNDNNNHLHLQQPHNDLVVDKDSSNLQFTQLIEDERNSVHGGDDDVSVPFYFHINIYYNKY